MPETIVTACALVFGNEILSGRTTDANLPYLGRRLNELGVRLLEARVVPDSEAAIVAALNEVRGRFDYVFTTGGIGPTHDDITAACVATAFGVPLIENPEALAILEGYYPPGQLTAARRRMARTPEGASLIANPVSAAPGFRIGNVFVMAGIPAVMQAMFESLAGDLAGGQPLRARSLTVHLPESVLSPGLAALQTRFPEVEMGSYPFHRNDRFGVTVVLRATDTTRLAAAVAGFEALVSELGAAIEDQPDA